MVANTPLKQDLVDLLWLLVGAGHEATPFAELPANWQTVALQAGRYLLEPSIPIAPTIHNRLWLVDSRGRPRGFPRWKPNPMAENQYCLTTLKLRKQRAKEPRTMDEGESIPMYLGGSLATSSSASSEPLRVYSAPTPTDEEITEAALTAAAEEVFGTEGNTPRVRLLEEQDE